MRAAAESRVSSRRRRFFSSGSMSIRPFALRTGVPADCGELPAVLRGRPALGPVQHPASLDLAIRALRPALVLMPDMESDDVVTAHEENFMSASGILCRFPLYVRLRTLRLGRRSSATVRHRCPLVYSYVVTGTSTAIGPTDDEILRTSSVRS
jgi:hypothetical protein